MQSGASRFLQESTLPELSNFGSRPAKPLGSALRLRVTATPTEVFQVGERVWLLLEPKRMVPIA
jgi:hypothetical protein